MINYPGHPSDILATNILLNIINCDFQSWINNTKNWSRHFWWQINSKIMPMCPNNEICFNISFLNQVCNSAPIKILTVNVDQIYILSLGKLLYDPWLSENTQIIYVSRDPRHTWVRDWDRVLFYFGILACPENT